MRLSKAAVGNKKLMDYKELRDLVIVHRIKTRNVVDCFINCNDEDVVLNYFMG